MKIETSHKITPNHINPKDGKLTISIHLDGKLIHDHVVISGPLADIRDYVDGAITLDELDSRWHAGS